jgi:DNA-binding FrmR family transcriptional regulator
MIYSKDKINLSIKKAVGTLTKVQKMIDDDVYCADIAHQINAAMGLLQSANRELLKNHLSCCGTKALAGQ